MAEVMMPNPTVVAADLKPELLKYAAWNAGCLGEKVVLVASSSQRHVFDQTSSAALPLRDWVEQWNHDRALLGSRSKRIKPVVVYHFHRAQSNLEASAGLREGELRAREYEEEREDDYGSCCKCHGCGDEWLEMLGWRAMQALPSA
jgi:hypothetical protein